MNNESSSAPKDSPPTPNPTERLRALLAEPKPKNAEWQDEAGRTVSMLVVRFSQEPDEAEALLIVALVFQAASKGVKEAKKRVLRLVRWAELPPPPLVLLGSLIEQRAALAALAKIKAPWTRGYVDEALANTELPLALLPDILRWARSANADWASFVSGTYAKAVRESGDLARTNLLLKEAPKLLRMSAPVAVPTAAEALVSLVRAIVAVAREGVSDRKGSAAVLQSGLGIVEQAWRASPALLLQPATVSANSMLSTAISTGKKAVPSSVDAACAATLTLIIDSIPRFGAQAVEHWRPFVPMWTSAYPDFVKRLKAASGLEPKLTALLSDENSSTDGAAELKRYAAEAAFAALLPAWDAFVGGLPDPSRAESLSSMLKRAAGAVGVETFGAVGEMINYDPLAHHLAESNASAPALVRAIRPGVLARREDGSTRILVRALVNTA